MQRERLEAAAALYSHLRGLTVVPLGVLLFVAALGNWEVSPFDQAWVMGAALVVTGAAHLGAVRYYRERFGRMAPTRRRQLRGAGAVGLAAAVVIVASLLLRSRADWSLDLPVNSLAVAFGAAMLCTYAIGLGLKPHHVVIWGGLLVVGGLPVWTGADPSNTGLVLAGACVIASGVLDHRLFLDAFGAPQLQGGDVARA